MTVPATNINLSDDVGVEFGRSTSTETSLEDASTGVYGAINTNNDPADRPDGSTPHSMSEFINYDHDLQPPNQAPTAVISGDTTGTIGTNVTLTSSLSSDPDGTIVGWDWEDVTESVTGTNPSFTVSNNTVGATGNRNYTLIVEDDDGAFSSQVTHTINWSDAAQSTSLRYDASSSLNACSASTVTVWHTGGFLLGTTNIYTTSALTTFAAAGYYATTGMFGTWSQWSAPGWSGGAPC